MDSNDVITSRKRLNQAYIKEQSGEHELNLISSLIIREQNLAIFEHCQDFDPAELISLEMLSLSHNKIFNLFGIAAIPNL